MSSKDSRVGWYIISALVLAIVVVFLVGYSVQKKRAAATAESDRRAAIAEQEKARAAQAKEARGQETLERLRSIETIAKEKRDQDKWDREEKSRAESSARRQKMIEDLAAITRARGESPEYFERRVMELDENLNR